MRFPVLAEEVLKFKERLVRMLNQLYGMVKTESEKKEISTMIEAVKTDSSERRLSSIHRQLTRDYSSYSQGFDLFGPSLQQSEAAAGVYKITLIVDGRTYVSQLKIRNDPLLDL